MGYTVHVDYVFSPRYNMPTPFSSTGTYNRRADAKLTSWDRHFFAGGSGRRDLRLSGFICDDNAHPDIHAVFSSFIAACC